MEMSELAGSTAASTSGTVHGVLVGEVSPIKTSSLLSLSHSLLLLSLSSLTSSPVHGPLHVHYLSFVMLPCDSAQKLYNLSIVFYCSLSVHTRRSDVYKT